MPTTRDRTLRVVIRLRLTRTPTAKKKHAAFPPGQVNPFPHSGHQLGHNQAWDPYLQHPHLDSQYLGPDDLDWSSFPAHAHGYNDSTQSLGNSSDWHHFATGVPPNSVPSTWFPQSRNQLGNPFTATEIFALPHHEPAYTVPFAHPDTHWHDAAFELHHSATLPEHTLHVSALNAQYPPTAPSGPQRLDEETRAHLEEQVGKHDQSYAGTWNERDRRYDFALDNRIIQESGQHR